MTRLSIFFLTLVLIPLTTGQVFAAGDDEKTTTTTTYDFPKPGETRVIGAEEIDQLRKGHGADLLVVNFWATWCSPCVKEIPYFVDIAEKYPEERVRVVGFSVDLKKDVESKVIPFLREREIPYPNLVLFVDQNKMINEFSEDWTGQIPATFFYDRDGEKLGEILEPVEYERLEREVEKRLPRETSLLEEE